MLSGSGALIVFDPETESASLILKRELHGR